MNDLEKNRSEYFARKAKVADMTQAIEAKTDEIAALEQQLTEAQTRAAEIKQGLSTAERDMAAGLLSTSDFLALKAEAQTNESTIMNLSTVLRAQKSAREMLATERRNGTRALNELRKRAADDIGKQSSDAIAEVASEPLKRLVYSLLGTKKPGAEDDVYRAMGVELCKSLFGGEFTHKAALPDVFEAKQQLDMLIEQPTEI